MLKRLFGSHQNDSATTTIGPAPGGDAIGLPARPAAAPVEWVPPQLPDVPVPSAEVLEHQWRQDVARISLELRERHPTFDQGHGERLLVKLAVDLDFSIRQPAHAAQEAFAVAADANCELNALIAIVKRDPALTRSLLRTSSSAFYGGSSAPASIDDAVRRLGGKGVQVAVLAGMAEALLGRPTGVFGPMASQVWAHMVRTGPIARTLARAFGVPAHEAFTVALLHDVGKLVLCDLAGALKAELRRDVLLPTEMATDGLVSLHEPLAGLALLRWGVDAGAARSAAMHHRAAPQQDRLAEVVFVAERLDLARSRGREVDLARWQEEGRLTADPSRVAAAVEQVLATADA